MHNQLRLLELSWETFLTCKVLPLTIAVWRTGLYYTHIKIKSLSMYLAFKCYKSISEHQSRYSNILQEQDSCGALLCDKSKKLFLWRVCQPWADGTWQGLEKGMAGGARCHPLLGRSCGTGIFAAQHQQENLLGDAILTSVDFLAKLLVIPIEILPQFLLL